MEAAIRCNCGSVRGAVDLARAYTRGTCYCRDCQAYARFLERPDMVDACGGTDVVPMSPAGVRVTAGLEHVACVSLSEKGILRWYANCCRTPLGNTPRDPKIAYIGMVSTCFDAAPEAIDAALGRRDRVVLNAKSATCEVQATPVAFVLGGLSILRHILAARFGRPPPSPFFDADGHPLRTAHVLTTAQREALGANRS